MLNLETIAQLAIAGGLGGAVVQYLGNSNERRQVRRDLVALIQKRMLGSHEVGFDETAEFKSAALLAGVPRQVVAAVLQSRHHYALQIAQESRVESELRQQGDETAGGEARRRDAARSRDKARQYAERMTYLASDFAWRPVTARLTWRIRLMTVPGEARLDVW